MWAAYKKGNKPAEIDTDMPDLLSACAAALLLVARVFALLKNLFGEEQMGALADYLQASLMLNYNKRNVG